MKCIYIYIYKRKNQMKVDSNKKRRGRTNAVQGYCVLEDLLSLTHNVLCRARCELKVHMRYKCE